MARRADIIISAIDRASPTFGKIRLGVSALAATAVAAGAIALGRTLVQGIAAATRAAAESEVAQQKLAQAIANSGQNVAATLPAVQAFNAALADQTGIDDDLIAKNQALLVSVGKLRGEGLERATKAAIDLATATGQPLESAFSTVAKAAAGKTAALEKMGIRLGEGGTQAERFERALKGLDAAFGGAAAAHLLTFEGALADVNRLFGELAETIGGPFREVGTILLNDFVRPLAKDLNTAAEETGGFRGEVFQLAIALAELGRPIEFLVQNAKTFGQALQLMRIGTQAGGAGVGALASGVFLLNQGLDTSVEQTEALIAALKTGLEAGASKLPPVLDKSTYAGAAEGAETLAGGLASVVKQYERWIELEALQRSYRSLETLPLEEPIARLSQGIGVFELGLKQALEGMALAAEVAMGAVAEVERQVNSFAFQAKKALGVTAVQGAFDFGDALVDGAFGADIAWSKFFKNLARQLTAAIVQALVLRAIMSAFPGFSSFIGISRAAGGHASWFGVSPTPVRADSGYTVPGKPNRGDVVPAYLTAGEIVLNRDQQRELLGRGGGGPMTVHVELGPNLRQIATAVSVEVNRGSARLVATETRRPNRNRRT